MKRLLLTILSFISIYLGAAPLRHTSNDLSPISNTPQASSHVVQPQEALMVGDYNQQTNRYEVVWTINGEEKLFYQMPVPAQMLTELRNALRMSNIDPMSVYILGLSGLINNVDMMQSQGVNGKKMILLNIPKLQQQEKKSSFHLLERQIFYFHEIEHIKQDHNNPGKTQLQVEVEADIGGLVTMNKHYKTKKILTDYIAFLLLITGLSRPEPYLDTFEQIYYGIHILAKNKITQDQQQALVNQVLQDRQRPEHKQQIKEAVYQLYLAGDIETTIEARNMALDYIKNEAEIEKNEEMTARVQSDFIFFRDKFEIKQKQHRKWWWPF